MSQSCKQRAQVLMGHQVGDHPVTPTKLTVTRSSAYNNFMSCVMWMN